MKIILAMELIGYIGMIWIQGRWYKRGELTANRFAIFQVTYLSLFILTGFLAISETFESTIVGIILSILVWVIGYPIARWIYKQMVHQ